jgi:hypothetical protein
MSRYFFFGHPVNGNGFPRAQTLGQAKGLGIELVSRLLEQRDVIICLGRVSGPNFFGSILRANKLADFLLTVEYLRYYDTIKAIVSDRKYSHWNP